MTKLPKPVSKTLLAALRKDFEAQPNHGRSYMQKLEEPKFRRADVRENYLGIRFELTVEFIPTKGSKWYFHKRQKRLAELRKEYHLLHGSRGLAEKAARAITQLPDVDYVTVHRLERTFVARFDALAGIPREAGADT